MAFVGQVMSLKDFSMHMAKVPLALYAELQAALEDVGKLVEQQAKDELGIYQQAVGPFVAWAPLAPATVADRIAKGYDPDEPLLREGDLRDSIEHQVSGLTVEIGSNNPVAVYQELGTVKIPPRPFLGTALFVKLDEIQNRIGDSTINAIMGRSIATAARDALLPLYNAQTDLYP